MRKNQVTLKNNMSKLYYIAPTNTEFEELKAKAIELWLTYDNEYGYATSKIGKIKDIKNIKDNFMFIFAMFDHNNQLKLVRQLSKETKQALKERLIDGGMDKFYLSHIEL